MKKVLLMFCAVLSLCGFSELAQLQSSALDVVSNNANWEVKMSGNSAILAYEPKSKVEVVIEFADVLPNSSFCMSNKRIKDIKMSLNIHKVATKGESNWEKSFEKTRITFRSKKGSEERKVYGSNLIKNNLRFDEGAVVNVGTLDFLAPFTCNDFIPITMRISGMSAEHRGLPVLDFTLQYK